MTSFCCEEFDQAYEKREIKKYASGRVKYKDVDIDQCPFCKKFRCYECGVFRPSSVKTEESKVWICLKCSGDNHRFEKIIETRK